MSRRPLICIALGLYCIALGVTAPATLLDAGLDRSSAGQLRLTGAVGTLWQGRGQLELRTPRGQHSLGQPVSWRLQPRYLLAGQLRFAVELTARAQPFQLSLRIGSVELQQLSLQLPASKLAEIDPKLSLLGLDGSTGIAISRLSISRDSIVGSAVLHWHNASSRLSPVSPLGDYRLRVDGDGAAMRLQLQTLRGPLQLDGNGRWRPGHPLEMSATARVPAPLNPQLLPLLRLVALERADGSFALDRGR